MAVSIRGQFDARVEEIDETVVVEAREHPELGLLPAGVCRVRGGEHLDGDVPAEHLVVRAEHGRQTASAQNGRETVTVPEEPFGPVRCLNGHVLHPSPQVYLLAESELNSGWGLTRR